MRKKILLVILCVFSLFIMVGCNFNNFTPNNNEKNAEQYEEKCDVLIVMDYIQSNEYYISTKAQYKICTVVRRIEDMEHYGFKGKPITLGSGSVLNIDFDRKIQDSQMQEVKDKLIRDKVEQWMKFGLIDDNIGNFN